MKPVVDRIGNHAHDGMADSRRFAVAGESLTGVDVDYEFAWAL